MITLTENARMQLASVAEKNGGDIRYQLNGGGCAGLIGQWLTHTDREEDDTALDLGEDRSLLIDPMTLGEMADAVIDYDGDPFSRHFSVTIPGTSSCGCGESFIRRN